MTTPDKDELERAKEQARRRWHATAGIVAIWVLLGALVVLVNLVSC